MLRSSVDGALGRSPWLAVLYQLQTFARAFWHRSTRALGLKASGCVDCIRQMTPHAFCRAFELLALEGIEDRQMLRRPAPEPLERRIAGVLNQSAQAVLLLYGLDQEGVSANACCREEGGSRLGGTGRGRQ